jgi:hypothetical protein
MYNMLMISGYVLIETLWNSEYVLAKLSDGATPTRTVSTTAVM